MSSFLGAFTFLALFSMWNLTRVEVRLCNILSPEAPRVTLRSYNWFLVFIAMLVGNFLYPISAVRSHFSQCINWSGIIYHLKDGKVNKIDRTLNQRSKDMGAVFTDLGGKHLYGKKDFPKRSSYLIKFTRSLISWVHQKKSE